MKRNNGIKEHEVKKPEMPKKNGTSSLNAWMKSDRQHAQKELSEAERAQCQEVCATACGDCKQNCLRECETQQRDTAHACRDLCKGCCDDCKQDCLTLCDMCGQA